MGFGYFKRKETLTFELLNQKVEKLDPFVKQSVDMILQKLVQNSYSEDQFKQLQQILAEISKTGYNIYQEEKNKIQYQKSILQIQGNEQYKGNKKQLVLLILEDQKQQIPQLELKFSCYFAQNNSYLISTGNNNDFLMYNSILTIFQQKKSFSSQNMSEFFDVLNQIFQNYMIRDNSVYYIRKNLQMQQDKIIIAQFNDLKIFLNQNTASTYFLKNLEMKEISVDSFKNQFMCCQEEIQTKNLK